MSCIEHGGRRLLCRAAAAITLVGLVGTLPGCGTRVPLSQPWPVPTRADPQPAPQLTPAEAAAVQAPVSTWEQYRERAALRMVAANPGMTYDGDVPEPLLAIPVIEVELRADGSVAKLTVLRHPGQARDTTQLAMDAINRAAPFGDVTGLPRPWKFAEVFLIDGARKFKPRTLDK